MVRILLGALAFFTFVSAARAEVLFEGYSKILSGGVHIGFVVSRFDYDAKKKQFSAIYLTKTGALGSDITESVKSLADENLYPISYEYTSLIGKKARTIDATFTKGQMKAVISEDGKTKTIRKDVAKGVFLSNFLAYVMLKGKNGLNVKDRYKYSAIAEEDAEVFRGDAIIEKEETLNGVHAFHVVNRFKDVKFTADLSDRGEVLGTASPANNINSELQSRPNDAVGNFTASPAILKKLFGEVPLGVENAFSKMAKEEALPSDGKKKGVAPGKDIEIKPGEVHQ